jgi:hypothetical protein
MRHGRTMWICPSSDSEIMGRVVGELDEDDADSGGRCESELTATWTIPARTLHQDLYRDIQHGFVVIIQSACIIRLNACEW